MQEELMGKKLPELRSIAHSMGIELPKSFLKKEEIVAHILSAKTAVSPSQSPKRSSSRSVETPQDVSDGQGAQNQKRARRPRRILTSEGEGAVATQDSERLIEQPYAEQPPISKVEPQVEPQAEFQPEIKAEPQAELQADSKEQPQGEPQTDARTDARTEDRTEARAEGRVERIDGKSRGNRSRRSRGGDGESGGVHNDNSGADNDRPHSSRHRSDDRHDRSDRFNAQLDFTGIVECTGSLEMVPDGYGFLRSADYNYINSPDDVYVSAGQIKQYGLKQGDTVQGLVRPPREGDKFFPLTKVITINGLTPDQARDRIQFEFLTPLFPETKFNITGAGHNNISNRIVDMFSPIGMGQRALIVAQPKTGKTILLKDLANAIADNHPSVYMIMLLIDERPEEVTDMARSVKAEVIASTFDEQASKHVKVAEMVLEKAKRLVECGHDVVIMLDSITRLARAYNTVQPTSNKILSGGVDAAALHKPKRFFGAARNTEEKGSLTIIATALIETGSKMDEVIFEEFKGTGNMELQLDRKLSNRRIYPAVDITSSSTRRDDLLQDKELQQKMWILRRHLSDMNSIEAMEFVKKHLEGTRNNDEFFKMMNQ